MSASETIGKILQGFGPGLLSGIGNALAPDDKPKMVDIHPGSKAPDPNSSSTAKPNAFKNGGIVKKTGLALVHKDEKIIPADEAKKGAPQGSGKNVSLHRAISHMDRGGLHRALGVKEGEPIPQEKLDAAKKGDNPHVAKMAHLASTMEGWHK